MIRKRNPLDENMTFGEGIPIDMPYNTEYRVLPSQFYPMVQEDASHNAENLTTQPLQQ